MTKLLPTLSFRAFVLFSLVFSILQLPLKGFGQCTPPAPPTASGATVNCGSSATLTASGAPGGGNYAWFDDPTGTNQISAGSTFVTPALSSATTYYVASSVGSGGTTTLYSQNWQGGTSGWSGLGGISSFNWVRINTAPSSSNTGPIGGSNNGTPQSGNYYVYLETSYGSTGSISYLTGPGFTIGSNATFSFRYHMYGSSMGSLAVEVFNGSSWTQVWSITGQQQNSLSAPWTLVTIPLSSFSGAINVRFRGVRGSSFRSDMAVDDILITQNTPPCLSSLVPVTVNVNGPTAPTANATSVNCGQPATLTASGAPSGGDYVWYDDAGGTNQVGTGATYTTPALSASSTYYVASTSGSASSGSATFTYTGSAQNWTVPAGVTQIDIAVWGAEGGGSALSGNGSSGQGGKGGFSSGTLNVTPGEVLSIYVGGHGSSSTSGVAAGGFNGGGSGYASSSGEPGNGGGGASDVRQGGNALSNRRIVAGGGGGGGEDSGDSFGHGGGLNGVGYSTTYDASQTGPGVNGALGQGATTINGDGGGGGGGYYGGGTNQSNSIGADTQGGGGGSGYIGGVSNGQTIAGNASMPNPAGGTMIGRSGHGLVQINYSATGCLSGLTAVTVTVNSNIPDPVAADQTVNCDQPATLTASGAPSGGSYTWFADPAGTTQVGTGSTYTTPALTTTTTYYVAASSGASSGNFNFSSPTIGNLSNPGTNEVYTIPGTPQAAGNATITVTARGDFDYPSGDEFLQIFGEGGYYMGQIDGPSNCTWYTGTYTIPLATLSSWISNGSITLTFDPGAGVNTNQCNANSYEVYFTISYATGGGCLSNLVPVNVNVNAAATPLVTNATINCNQTANLSANSSSSITWYSDSGGTSQIGTGGSYTTPALTTSTTYYVQSGTGACASQLVPVTATVSAAQAPTANNVTINCQSTASLSTAANNSPLYWFSNANGTGQVSTGVSYTTPVLNSSTTYYIQAGTGTCASQLVPVTVTVNAATNPAVNNTSVNCGSTTTLTASSNAPIIWYSNANGTGQVGAGANYTTPALSQTTTYYVQAGAAGCASQITPVTVTVNGLTAPTANAAAVNCGQTAALTAQGGTGSGYTWFTNANGTGQVGTGASFTPPVLGATTTYYVASTAGMGGGNAQNFSFTGGVQTYTVPAGVTQLTVDARGAGGGVGPGGGAQAGTGGRIQGTISVSPGQVLTIVVGGAGGNSQYNRSGSGGGGFSGILDAGGNHLISAGGGGGSAGNDGCPQVGSGGNGGSTSGTNGSCGVGGSGGSNAAGAAGGAGGSGTISGQAGTSTGGGNGGATPNDQGTGGGGGGFGVTPGASQYGSCGGWSGAGGYGGGGSGGTGGCGSTQERLSGAGGGGGGYRGGGGGSSQPGCGSCGGGGGGGGSNFSIAGTTNVVSTVGGGSGPQSNGLLSITPVSTSCQSALIPVIITITPATNPSVTNATTNCQTTTTLSASSNSPITWFSNANGTGQVSTGATYTTPVLTSSTTYYLQAGTGACASQLVPVTATVSAAQAPTANNVTINCQSTASLSTAANNSPLYWYSNANGTGQVSTGVSYTTPVLNSNTTYYLQAGTGACASQLVPVTANVSTAQAPSVNNASVNCGATATVSASANSPIYWFSNANGTGQIGSGNNYTSGQAIYAPTTVYVQAGTGACASQLVPVTAAPNSQVPSVQNTSTNCGSTATLTANGGNNFTWFTNANGTGQVGSGANFTTPALNATTTYYVASVTGGGVSNFSHTSATQSVYSNPGTTAFVVPATPQANGNATLTVYVRGDIDNSTEFVTVVSETGNLGNVWGGSQCGGFTSATYTISQATLNSWVANGSINLTFNSASSVNNICGFAFQAYFTISYQSGSPSCTSATTPVVVSINPLASPVITGNTSICSSSNTQLTASGSAGTYNWYANANGTGSLGSGASFTTPNLNANTTYYIQASNNGCTSNVTPVSVSVTASPAAPSANAASICTGQTATLNASANANWYTVPNGGASIGQAQAYTTPSLNNTVTYYMEGVNGPCLSATRTPVTVTVNAGPASNAGSSIVDASTCGKNSVNVGGNALAAGQAGQWTVLSAVNNAGIPGIFSMVTSANDVFTGHYGATYVLQWQITNQSNGCVGTDTMVVTFNQPSDATISGLIGTGDLLWCGLTGTDWSTSTNWYQKQAAGHYIRMSGAVQPAINNEVFTVSTANGGMCVGNSTPSLSVNSNAEDVYVGAGVVLNLSNDSINIAQNLINQGTIAASTGTVNFTGNINSTVSGSGTTQLFNMRVNKSAGATLTLQQPVLVTNVLTMNQGNVFTTSANLLTLGTSSAAPGSLTYNSGTIVGPFKRYFANAASAGTAGLFPVGTAVYNRYADFNFGSGPGVDQHLTVEYMTGAPLQGGIPLYNGLPLIASGSLIQNYSADGYWSVIPTNNNYTAPITSVNYGVTLFANNLTGMQSPQVCRIIKSAGSNTTGQHHVAWQACGTHTAINGAANPQAFLITSTATQGFSWFNIGTPNSQALPVELLSFNGDCNEGQVNISWQTATEHNSDYFEVEKSRDGMNWQVLTTVNAAGNSTQLLNYEATDAHAMEGNNYYRLTQVDIDGTTKTYDVINVSCSGTAKGYFSAYPNPSTGSFQVILNDKNLVGSGNLSVKDTKGAELLNRTIEVKPGINMFSVTDLNLAPGVYYIQIVNGERATDVLKEVIR
jgi:Glycine rich protein/MAM domain, meprin/A5/mu/Ig-like domain CHU_C associated